MDLVVEPDIYAPNIDGSGNYIDAVPSMRKGIRCPCGSRKDKIYETHSVFSAHVKTKTHQKWLSVLNQNKMNYFLENISLKETIDNQRLIIARLEKDLNSRMNTIDYLTEQLTRTKHSTPVVNNLLDLDF
jgi:hypothetical protein